MKAQSPLLISLATLSLVGFSLHSAAAQTLLTDNFNTENGGAGTVRYSAFTNFNVTSGNVDLIGSGYYDYYPGNGLYVDLSGDNAGVLTSKTAFSLTAGTYQLNFSLGNPAGRESAPPGGATTVLSTSTTVSLGAFFTQTYVQSNGALTPFTNTIVVTTPGAANLSFASNTPGANGTILDNVSLVKVSSAAAPEPGSIALLALSGLPVLGMVARRRGKG